MVKKIDSYKINRSMPHNFNFFWDTLIKNSSYSDLEIYESDYKLEEVSTNHLFFTADDGAKIHAKYTYPLKTKIKGVILLFHGYHVNCGEWMDKVGLSSLGFTVFALDCRGQSGLSVDNQVTKGSTLKGHIVKGLNEGKENLLYKDIYLDTYRLSLIAEKLYPNLPLISTGVSQGGALSLACSALNTNIKLTTPTYPYLCNFEKSIELGMPYDGIENYIKFEDPRGENFDYLLTQLDYIDIAFLATRVQGHVELFSGETDDICPIECQLTMYNNLNCSKNITTYPFRGHEYLDGQDDIKLQIFNKHVSK